MGALLRSVDWSKSSLGPPESWPQSLRAIVGLMLNSKFPMFVAWGEELGFIYNDAYSEILGDKHPRALGQPFQQIWGEIWDDISPLVDRALEGEASWLEDMPLTMNRHGYEEPTWFTFSYSPVYTEENTIGGMYCACTETTKKVVAERENAAQQDRMMRMFEQAPGFMAMVRGPDHVFELANAAYIELAGPRDFIGIPARKALPEVEGQGFFEALDEVYRSGNAFTARSMAVNLARGENGKAEERFLDFVYQPVTDNAGRVTGIFIEGYDVTERKLAEDHQRLLIDELNHRVKNMLAVVQSIALQTLKGDAATVEARTALDRRLGALAATHKLLTRKNWSALSISDVVADALEAFRDGEQRITASGPDIRIEPKTAITLALAIHELATNAAKHGALSVESGQVALEWEEYSGPDEEPRFRLTWSESGGPTVEPPSRRGFGTRLIEQGLAVELEGKVNIAFEPGGIVCTVDAPLPRVPQ